MPAHAKPKLEQRKINWRLEELLLIAGDDQFTCLSLILAKLMYYEESSVDEVVNHFPHCVLVFLDEVNCSFIFCCRPGN